MNERYFTTLTLFVILFAFFLELYRDRIYKRTTDNRTAIIMKRLCHAEYYFLLFGLIVISTHFVIRTIVIITSSEFLLSNFLQFQYIVHIALTIAIAYWFFTQRKFLIYFRKMSPSIIVAGYYLRKHSEALNSRNIDDAKKYLIKACETEPTSVELWCRLAFFYEVGFGTSTETDECIEKAKTILEENKTQNNKEIACFENYLGYILCSRGKTQEGIRHIKKSIDIDPNHGRIKRFKEKLAELKLQNKTESND